MTIDYYTSQGGREVNEDSLYTRPDGDNCLALVADGLGGHGGGDLASQTAVHVISEALTETGAISEDAIVTAISDADRVIAEKYTGSRTTIALLSVNGDHGFAAHVGDSRIYQFRDGEIIFQSRDHSVCQMYVMIGEISPDEIRGHAERNRLLRALGGDELARIDLSELDVRKGDAFLLCSDGFWENIVEEEMIGTLSQANSAAAWLSGMTAIVSARINGSSDNNTAIAVLI